MIPILRYTHLTAGALAFASLALLQPASAAVFEWTGGDANNNNWTDADNWGPADGTDANANGYPDGGSDDARFEAEETTVPNTIDLNNSLSVNQLYLFGATGTEPGQGYTINGAGTLSGTNAYGVRNTSNQTLTLNVSYDVSQGGDNVRIDTPNGQTIFDDTIIGDSGVTVRPFGSGGLVEFNAANTYSGNTDLRDGTFEVVSGNAQAFSSGKLIIQDDGYPTLSLASDTTVQSSFVNNSTGSSGAGVELRVLSGDTDRAMEVQDDVDGSGLLVLGANANGDDGNVIFRHAPIGSTGNYYLNTQISSDALLEYDTSAQVANIRGGAQISGDGSLRKVGSNVLQVRGADTELTYTGGTRIESGSMTVLSDAPDSLPDVGTIAVVDTGVLDVRNSTETIGGLTGNGRAEVGDTTLTVNDDFAPGDEGVGKLTIRGDGTLALADTHTSVFELTADDSTSDQVLMGEEDTTGEEPVVVSNILDLAGTLQIVDAGGLQTGDYTLFDHLFGGTTNGNYDDLILPSGFSGSTSIAPDGDVVLNVDVVPEPASLALLGVGSLLIIGRRERRA